MSKQPKSKNSLITADTSKYDPTRKTVGSIYLEAQQEGKNDRIIVGDLTNEMMGSLVEDLNKTIESNPFDGKPFYITVHEKKDLQMRKMILRRMIVSQFRPFPEDDTIVYHVEPRQNRVSFCWCLPHHTEMANVLTNFLNYNKDYVNDIRAFKAQRWDHFGFTGKDPGKIQANERQEDKIIA